MIKLAKALAAWSVFYSDKLSAIIAGDLSVSSSGYEQDVYEAIGCKVYRCNECGQAATHVDNYYMFEPEPLSYWCDAHMRGRPLGLEDLL